MSNQPSDKAGFVTAGEILVQTQLLKYGVKYKLVQNSSQNTKTTHVGSDLVTKTFKSVHIEISQKDRATYQPSASEKTYDILAFVEIVEEEIEGEEGVFIDGSRIFLIEKQDLENTNLKILLETNGKQLIMSPQRVAQLFSADVN